MVVFEIRQMIKPVNQFGEMTMRWTDDRWETIYDAKINFANMIHETILKNPHWTQIGVITDSSASFYYFDDVLNKNIEICYKVYDNSKTEEENLEK